MTKYNKYIVTLTHVLMALIVGILSYALLRVVLPENIAWGTSTVLGLITGLVLMFLYDPASRR